jgi:hypothetical protein
MAGWIWGLGSGNRSENGTSDPHLSIFPQQQKISKPLHPAKGRLLLIKPESFDPTFFFPGKLRTIGNVG